jgi:LAS superfamily LD-carboxypeptidase LdcB
MNTSFENTDAYKWLQENGYRYGFILSYPKGNSYYVYEPWHWRFVSEDLARRLHRKNENFYDWDQRDIDQYLLNFFD